MAFARARIVYALIATAWAGAVAFGLTRLWNYESTPSAPASAPLTWPADTRVARAAGLPTLVLFAHPRCPCTRATVRELARLMTECHGKLTTTVLVLRPAGMASGWERTDLWYSAAQIPGVTVVIDDGGAESRRFGAVTSGQVVLYSTSGSLLFSGGITESRGHEGDNAGSSAVESLVLANAPTAPAASALAAHTPVYGCPLFDESSVCLTQGNPECRKK